MLPFVETDPFSRAFSANERFYYHHQPHRLPDAAPHQPQAAAESSVRLLSLGACARATPWQAASGSRRDRWI